MISSEQLITFIPSSEIVKDMTESFSGELNFSFDSITAYRRALKSMQQNDIVLLPRLAFLKDYQTHLRSSVLTLRSSATAAPTISSTVKAEGSVYQVRRDFP